MTTHILIVVKSKTETGAPAILVQFRPAPLGANENWRGGGTFCFWGGAIAPGQTSQDAIKAHVQAKWGIVAPAANLLVAESEARSDGITYELWEMSLADLQTAGLTANGIRQGVATFMNRKDLSGLEGLGKVFGVASSIIEDHANLLFS